MRAVKIFLVYLFLAHTGFSGVFKQCDNSNNVIAKRLMGNWVFNQELSGMLGDANYGLREISFVTENSTLALFPPLSQDDDVCVYLSGVMNIYGDKYEMLDRPFALIAQNGMPAIVWLDSFDEGSISQERFSVSVLAALHFNDDLLTLSRFDHWEETQMVIFNRPHE